MTKNLTYAVIANLKASGFNYDFADAVDYIENGRKYDGANWLKAEAARKAEIARKAVEEAAKAAMLAADENAIKEAEAEKAETTSNIVNFRSDLKAADLPVEGYIHLIQHAIKLGREWVMFKTTPSSSIYEEDGEKLGEMHFYPDGRFVYIPDDSVVEDEQLNSVDEELDGPIYE